jgi:hypothetical protein
MSLRVGDPPFSRRELREEAVNGQSAGDAQRPHGGLLTVPNVGELKFAL